MPTTSSPSRSPSAASGWTGATSRGTSGPGSPSSPAPRSRPRSARPAGSAPGSPPSSSSPTGAASSSRPSPASRTPSRPTSRAPRSACRRALPPQVPAPRLLWSSDDGDWVILGFEVVHGRSPELPWKPERPARRRRRRRERSQTPSRCPGTRCRAPTTSWPTTSPAGASCTRSTPRRRRELRRARPATSAGGRCDNVEQLVRWEQESLRVCAGDSLVHGDLRADNVHDRPRPPAPGLAHRLAARERRRPLARPRVHAAQRRAAGRRRPGDELPRRTRCRTVCTTTTCGRAWRGCPATSRGARGSRRPSASRTCAGSRPRRASPTRPLAARAVLSLRTTCRRARASAPARAAAPPSP